jgi:hypothetical protein
VSRSAGQPDGSGRPRRRLARWAAVSALLLVAGCDRGDVRPWMICYRIYDQCKEVLGALTQPQCELLMAHKAPGAVEALVDCVRDNPCPGIARRCHPLPARPR